MSVAGGLRPRDASPARSAPPCRPAHATTKLLLLELAMLSVAGAAVYALTTACWLLAGESAIAALGRPHLAFDT